MQPALRAYKAHRNELRVERADSGNERVELLIDDEPVAYGQLADGTYYLHENAYEWDSDLMRLAERLIDRREHIAEQRALRASKGGV
jgi:hypothetical protein